MIRVSLDLENVLAAVNQVFIMQYNEQYGTTHSFTDISSWEWVSELRGIETYLNMTNTIWKNKSRTIQPCEPCLHETVARLSETPNVIVDIVTARTGVEQEMREWLSTHNITSYNTFKSIPVTETKAELDYDVFIDDKPYLDEKLSASQSQYMIVQPWNETYHSETVTKVPTVKHAVNLIQSRHID